jgi:hypothetical protein
MAIGCCVASLAFLWPHYEEPEVAYLNIDHTSAVQELLPFENNQRHNQFFKCAQGHGWVPACFPRPTK